MSASPQISPMPVPGAGNATLEARFEPMLDGHLDAVAALEQRAYAQPWQRRHFDDCLQAGYQAQLRIGVLTA